MFHQANKIFFYIPEAEKERNKCNFVQGFPATGLDVAGNCSRNSSFIVFGHL